MEEAARWRSIMRSWHGENWQKVLREQVKSASTAALPAAGSGPLSLGPSTQQSLMDAPASHPPHVANSALDVYNSPPRDRPAGVDAPQATNILSPQVVDSAVWPIDAGIENFGEGTSRAPTPSVDLDAASVTTSAVAEQWFATPKYSETLSDVQGRIG